MISRTLSVKIRQWAREYPVITLTGPRQSGKSTLCRSLFPRKPYVNLEDLAVRTQAIQDPHGFLARFPQGAVFDEIQRAPDLPSTLQGLVDARAQQGQFILTGSQQFELMASVSQSLAGRTAVARLLPFSCEELWPKRPGPLSLDELLFTGFYPRIHDQGLNPTEALGFYFSTYVERDLRALLRVKDMGRFETFMRLLAGRSGQLLNTHALAGDLGVSHNTVGAWVTVLEQSFLVYRLKPWFANIGKRLLKSPKLYFLDSGLLCWLLDIHSGAQVATHPLRGQIFESMVVSELLKARYHRGLPDTLYYVRDSRGAEVDLLSTAHGDPWLMEIKSSATFHPEFTRGLEVFAPHLPAGAKKYVVLGAETGPGKFKEVNLVGYRELPG